MSSGARNDPVAQTTGLGMRLQNAQGLVAAVSGLAVALGGMAALPAQDRQRDDSAPRPAFATGASCADQTSGSTLAAGTPPAEQRRDRLATALQKGFGVQYWGRGYTVDALAAAPHGLLIIEATKTGASQTGPDREVLFKYDELRKINRNGTRPVLGYLNVAEIEDYRDYWVPVRRSSSDVKHTEGQKWIGPRTSTAEQLALYWTPEWQDILFERVDTLMSLGFDGIFLDDVLQYYSFASGTGLEWTGLDSTARLKDAPAYARAMMRLVENIAARSRKRNCAAIVIVNNGVFIGRDAGPEAAENTGQSAFARYRDAIDAILVEDVFASKSREPTVTALKEDFFSNGTEVLAIDFGTLFPAPDMRKIRESLSLRSHAVGFTSYLADNAAFDQLYPPITHTRSARSVR